MNKYTTSNKTSKVAKSETSESEKAAKREANAVKRNGSRAYERKPFSLLG